MRRITGRGKDQPEFAQIMFIFIDLLIYSLRFCFCFLLLRLFNAEL